MTHTPIPPTGTPAAAADRPAGGLSRRAVVTGAGGVVAAGLLTACGGGSTATSPGTPAAAPAPAPSEPAAAEPSGGSAASSSGTALGTTTEIPVGGGKVFADQAVVVTQPEPGDFKAFSATCTHQGCTVATVADGNIICPCHDSRFSVTDGAVTNGPATRPLAARTVSVEGNEIVLA